MNVTTRELISFDEVKRLAKEDPETLKAFNLVPDELEGLAKQELGDKKSVILPENHPIVTAMRNKTKDPGNKKKAKKKMQKQSKIKNR